MPDVPAIENKKLKKSEGEYVSQGNKPVKIQVNSQKGNPAFTAIHEIGHFIDHQGLGSDGYGYASEDQYPQVKKLMEAINRTSQVKQLAKELARSIPGSCKEYLKEHSKETEKFARAYSQWVAVRSQDPEILDALAKEKAMKFDKMKVGEMFHWDDESFAPIADLFDAMFREKGWLGG